MKKAFIRILAVICAVLLLSGAFAAWASASTATPTDLSSVETDREAENTNTEEPGEPDPEEPVTPDPEEPGEGTEEPGDPTGEPGTSVTDEPGEEPGQEINEEPETKPEEKPQEKPAEKPDNKPENKPQEKPEDKPAEKPAEKPDEKPEETVEDEEVLITKTVKVGDTWSGRMSKTRPAILKLEVGGTQIVHMLVEGKHVWAAVEKSDHPSDNPSKTRTDDETNQVVISWSAKAGSYLIVLGPVEPNLMAQGKVTFMNDAAYEAWQAKQEEAEEEPAGEGEGEPEEKPEGEEPEENTEPAEETEPEAADGAEEGTEPEGEGEPEDGTEPEEGAEPEEGTEPEEGEPTEETEPEDEPEENADPEGEADPEEGTEPDGEAEPDEDTEPEEGAEPEDETNPEEEEDPEADPEAEEEQEELTEEEEEEAQEDEALLLSLRYFKVQIAMEEGVDLFESTEEGAEPVEHLETGAEIWVKATENEEWAEVYNPEEEAPNRFVKWSDLIIILKPADEEGEGETEELPARYIEIESTIRDYHFISPGTEITMTAKLYNFLEDDVCAYQWKYYDQAAGDFVDIEGANEPVYKYNITEDNIFCSWKLVVTILNGAE